MFMYVNGNPEIVTTKEEALDLLKADDNYKPLANFLEKQFKLDKELIDSNYGELVHYENYSDFYFSLLRSTIEELDAIRDFINTYKKRDFRSKLDEKLRIVIYDIDRNT